MKLPRISVVIPLYNHAAYIAEAIFSVLSQTYPVHEIIIVDDGSKDHSAEVVREVMANEPRIRFWTHENRGAHNTINAGIHRAQGDYIAILNSDDLYESRRFELACKYIVDNSYPDIVCTGINFINNDGKFIENKWYAEAMNFHRGSDDLALSLINANIYMTTSNFIIKRSLFGEIGGFANLRYAHDLDFLLRAVSRGRSVMALNEPLLRYRRHDSNTIDEGAHKVKVEWAACIAMYLYSSRRREIFSRGDGDFRRCLQILETHGLTSMVLALILGFSKLDLNSLEYGDVWKDRRLVALLEELAR